jgi:SAM-dependent methyltransferase
MLRSAKDHGYAVEAVEHSQSLARVIQERTGVKVRIGAFEDQTIDSGAFDAFLSFHVIEHVPNVQAHLAKAAEVVRPGGYAIIATPNAGSWEHNIPFGLSPNYSSAHLQLFSERSMKMFLERTGWLLMEVHTPSYSEAWARVATSVFRRLRGKANSIQRGDLVRGEQSHKLRWVMQVFGAVTFPIRWVQEQLHWGNELIVVAKRQAP